ncbi:Hint domain-containing protein [Brevirhabdus sp.]|uniref:Hint domain-containing protein n=1 Tax=Brevirhabdus sp. TaxID=2004514 RepID=UPI004059CB19
MPNDTCRRGGKSRRGAATPPGAFVTAAAADARPGRRPDPAPGSGTLSGLLLGTHVYTSDGVLPVEFLMPGDRLITRDAGARELRSIRYRHIPLAPVQVDRGALGCNSPGAPLLLLPTQPVLLRGARAQALSGRSCIPLPAAAFIDGRQIRQAPQTDDHILFRLDLGGGHILYADGVEVLCAPLAPSRLHDPAQPREPA